MNLFDVQVLAYLLDAISRLETEHVVIKMQGYGGHRPSDALFQKGINSISQLQLFCIKHGLSKSADSAKKALFRWGVPGFDNSAACELLNRLKDDTIQECGDHHFLRVDADRVLYLEQDSLFGTKVNDAFTSSVQDIKEAGNCLAAECNTAAVFHLMRASEVALRAVAVDRRVSFANKPLDQQEWGTILGALEGKVKDLRLANASLWSKPEYREAQIRFYNEAIQELRGFNEAWRRHISHADKEAFYDRFYAAGILKHVRVFMQKLATKISETTFTLEYWDSE